MRRNKLEAMAEQVANENNQQRAIREYIGPVVNDHYSSIARLTMLANNFELKSRLM